MASSNLKTMKTPLTPAVEKGQLVPIKRSVTVSKKTATIPLQVKCENGHKPLTTKGFSISRREMMQCLTAEVLGLTLLPKPAEARPSRLEGKRKIMEKLQELREKVGLSKPKPEKGMETESPTKPSPKDKSSPTLPLPTPDGGVGPLVEAILTDIPPPPNGTS